MRLGNSSLFTFAVQGSNDEFRVVKFDGRERVSAPFYFVVTIATTNFELETSTLINKSACLTLLAEEVAPRHIHGCIESIMMMDVGRRFATYQVVLTPKLHRLARRSQQKIFQQQDAQQMMRTILVDAGLIEGDDFRFEITGTLAQRTYTTQYAESDLDFFNRILAEDGLHYHFQFSADRHVLLISDTQYIFQRLTETPEIPFVAHTGLLKRDYVIHDFSLCTKLQPNKVTLKDYNFTKPSLNLETSEQMGSGDFEVYHHGSLYQEPDLGQQQVQTLLKAFQATSECGHGESNCVYLSAGKLFKLTDHNNPVFNQEYLLLEVQHAGAQPQSLEEGASNGPSGYMSQFICIPKTTEFKAKPPKPKVNKRNRFDGVQNATVVGPKGEEIYTDQYGRIKVQFNWDKDGQADEKSSRWIRVTQPWTGSSWGAIQIPRIGQEILVSFVNGDPDRPLIKGVMYNGRNKPPYKLPDNKTRTTVKTCSTPGGQGFNELRFEDKKADEQIFIHGERDQDIKIENDKDLRVYRDRHLVVDKQYHVHIKQLLSESIHGTWKEDMLKKQHITVKQDFTEKAKTNYNREAGKEIHIKSSGKMVFDAGMQLSVSGSGSYFTLDPSGVKINGPTVRINAGGSPGRGAKANPLIPQPSDLAPSNSKSSSPVKGLTKGSLAQVNEQTATNQKKEKQEEVEVEAIDIHIKLPYLDNSAHFWIGINSIFGNDIPIDEIENIRKQALTSGIPKPKVELMELGSGRLGASANNIIYIDKSLANKAVNNPRAEWLLFLVIAEEYGHYLDNYIRQQSQVKLSEQPGDEGRVFAGDLIHYFKLMNNNQHFATLELTDGTTKVADLSSVSIETRKQNIILAMNREADDRGTLTLKSGKKIEVEFFKIRGGGAVHEAITEQAAKQAGIPFDPALRKGVAWPDVPCEDPNSVETCYVNLVCMEVHHKATGKDNSDNIAYQSHYQKYQIWHSMSYDSNTTNFKIKDDILQQAIEWYSDALKHKGKKIVQTYRVPIKSREHDPFGAKTKTRVVTNDYGLFFLGKLLHMVQDSFSHAHTIRNEHTNEILSFQDYTKQDSGKHGEHDKWTKTKQLKDIPGALDALKATRDIMNFYRKNSPLDHLNYYLDHNVYSLHPDKAEALSGEVREDTRK